MKRTILGGKLICHCVILLISIFNFSLDGTAQGKVKIHGKVTNEWTGEGAFGVTVYIESLEAGTATDLDGNYELIVPAGTFRVQFSRVDLKTEVVIVDAVSDKKINVGMKDKLYNLDAVTVFAESQDAQIKSLDVGKNTLSIERINSLPAFMGEADVIKSLIMLPGVSTVGEGSSGFNVRGGGVDQNLILQDGALIFNPSHVFGFFSAFNPQAVSDATLYKSGIPAQYGGRLSSVLNVSLKEGDFQQYHMDAGIGLVSSKLTVEGPILKDKISFLAGIRGSYSDWMLNAANSDDFANSSAQFLDTNVKLSFIINEKNKLSYSGYYSNDGFGFASDTTFDWSTFNHSLIWKHIFNEEAVLDVSLVNGNYEFNIDDPEGINSFIISSNIGFQSLKANYSYEWSNRNKLEAGAETTFYRFHPGEQKPLSDESGVEYLKLENERSIESAVFIEDEYKITPKLSLRAGLRYSIYQSIGSGTDYIFAEGDSKKMENIVDTIYHKSGEVFKTYGGFEPRVNVNYTINPESSIKASYNRMRQYLHLLSNTAAVTPTDFWKTSNYYIPPEVGDQFSLGYFRNFKNNTIEASVEAYYKTADNIVDFKNGTKLLMNEYIEADLLNGTSEAYGIEFFVNKKAGRVTGWASYTFSRTFRTVNGTYEDEIISGGDPYPANYDKPHDFTFAMNYEPNPVVTYGVNFSYSSGRPTTAPLGVYDYSNLTNVFNYSKRNAERIPDYHRLDVSMTIKSKPRVDRKWKMEWVLAVYNLYGHKNAYSVFFENQYGYPPKAYKLSVLGSPFPSLAVNFKL